MTKIILTLTLFLVSLFSFSQEKSTEANTRKITASIVNAVSNKGKVFFALYKEDGFSKREAIQSKNSLLTDGKASVIFNVKETGTYAIICYHDSNNNNRMDFNEMGMPLEDYGASNNVTAFGPPQFNDVKFELKNEDLKFDIKF